MRIRNYSTMKKTILALFLFSTKLVAQPTHPPVEVLSVIVTHKTTSHLKVPNTNIYLVPPTKFKISNSFSGLEKNDSTIIICYELLDKEQIAKLSSLDKPVSEQSGIKVIEFKKILVNNSMGVYMLFQKDGRVNAYSLIFGDDTFRVMITATGLATDVTLKDEILTVFNMIYYEKK